MCGIAGFRSFAAELAPDSLRRIAGAMTATLMHRGPDDGDLWVDPEAGLALGHRRLSIIDLSAAGRQPMASACGRYLLTYNGEIYNFPALRARLEASGHRFRGHSDTEVLLAALGAWGVSETLGQLNGMFAFALWDRQQRCMTLARDRAGKKPLYYGWCGGTFLFGSELKALRAHPEFEPVIDRDALGLFVQYSWMPAPYAIYAGVRQLPAGMVLTVTDDPAARPEPVAYWSAREVAARGASTPLATSLEEATDGLEDVLRDAVACRMIADVSLGAFLSGGIDSSTIVALMRAVSSKPVQTFSIGYHEPKYNEAVYAKAIAEHLGTDHTELYVTPEDCLEVIPRLPTLYDEPFADYSQIPTFLVSQLARRQVTVALSGDGGDELFGGYSRYLRNLKDWDKQAAWRHVPDVLRQGLASMMTQVGAQGRGVLGARFGEGLRKLEKRGKRITPVASTAAMHARLRATIDQADQLVLGARAVPSSLTDASGWAGVADPMLGMMLVDFTTYMADDILTKVDRASMGVSLEVRCPLLDPRVVEYAWNLPTSMRIGPKGGKHILQNLLARHVPRALFERPKQGFNVPIEEWLRGPLRDWGEALLDESRLRREGYLRPREVRQIWTDHLAGRRSSAFLLWSLLTFQAWHETWIASDRGAMVGAAA